MLRKLLSHAAIYGLAAQLPRVAGVLALPIITPYLTTTDYGVAGVVTAYVTALGMVQSLGLSVVMVNAFVKHPTRYKWVWRQVGGLMSVWSFVFGVALASVLCLGIPNEAGENKWAIIVLNCLPVMLFAGTELQTNLFYQLSQRPLTVAVRSLIVGVVSVGFNVYTIAFLQLGYMGWFYASFIAAFTGFAINFNSIYLKEELWPILKLNRNKWKSWLRISLPVVPHQLSFFVLDTSDKLMLNWLGMPIKQIGNYNLASNFGSYYMTVSGAIVQASSPFYMSLYAQNNSIDAAYQVRRLTFALQILFLVTTTAICIWMKEIFELLIQNVVLQQAYPLAIIILMAYNFRPMYLAVVNWLTLREYTGKLWRISLVAGLSNVVLNLVFIPWFGYEAAAFTTFVCFMYMGYAGYFIQEFRQSVPVNFYPFFWFILTVIALLLAYYMSDSSINYKIVTSTVLGLIGVVSGIILKKKAASP
ncbi:lipopolysaccharide biosynthesis protein [Pontibacter chinhatensis]|uniref:Membrane protein involved in the export of O-antigen and teichoic acid n=1 Tax=Pontibacter chinhatensis TaxID=1436961 RepID=A0A1I2VFT2_9BACT|nr:lipopolysaccharide biosynthesis protein [Pontibacter chinhatensis]SFG88062.1 Membrane protein involved in the export of O-antigen and teichoic acid [Pontibacter chinhatensis]